MDPYYPKTLFVTACAFNRITGGGITFSNLFRGWPKDRLATVHKDSVPTSSDVCERYYRLRWQELSPSVPRTARVLNVGHLSRSLEEWIHAFGPEVIYTILGTVGYVQLVRAIAHRFRIPVVVHFMDEGVTDPQLAGPWGRLTRRLYGTAVRRAVQESTTRLGICPQMSRAYSERFGVPFDTFMNTVEVSRLPVRGDLHVKTPVRLVYTGAVLPYSQSQSLRDVAEAVRALNRSGQAYRLDVYAPLRLFGNEIAGLADDSSVFIHDAIEDHERYFQTLQDADILISPVNFDAASVHFLRYSMPTKVPSYLASGTPILVYGPSAVSQVNYAEEESWALVINERNSDKLQQAILRLAMDEPLRTGLSQHALQAARRFHDSAVIRDRFRSTLAQAAGHA